MRYFRKLINSVFSNKQMKKNAIVAIFLAVLIFVCILGVFSNYSKNYINHTIDDLEFESNSYAEYFKKEYNTNCDYIKLIADLLKTHYSVMDNEGINDIKIEEIKYIFNSINEEDNFISKIYFVDDKSGEGISSKGFVAFSDMATDLRERDWYKAANQSDEVIISDVYEDINTQKPCMTLSYTLRNEGQLLGVLAADIFLEDFNAYYSGMVQDNETKLTVLSENGIIIIDNNNENLGRDVRDVLNKYIDRGSDYSWNKIKDKDSGEIRKYEENNKNINLYYSTISEVGWKVFCIADSSITENAINKTLYILLLIGVVVYLLMIIFLLYYTAKNENTDMHTGFMKLSAFGKMIEYNKTFMKSQFLLFVDIKNYNFVKTELTMEEYEKFMEIYSYNIRQAFKKSYRIARGRDGILIVSPAHPEIKHFKNTINKAIGKFDKFEVDFNGDVYKLEMSFYLVEYSKENLIDFTKNLIKSEEAIIKKEYASSRLIDITYDELIEKSRQDLKKLKFLRNSIENSNIVPFYQPIIDVASGKIEKYEVLMRIKDGDNYLAPYPYILIAEKYNIINLVDSMVLEKALQFKNKNDKEDKLIFSFNVSGKSVNDGSYLRKATSLVDKYSISHDKIDFEITETEKLYDISKTNDILMHYVNKGYSFSVDDFGTAYASIAYLKQIPASVVKIDGSFIKDMDKNEENYYLVKSMIAMAKGYKKKALAEFVETEEVYNKLVELGIDLVQGYYIGKPADDILK
ncbi:EAL domain-containing protein [Clostridium sp. DL1XJH146]